MVIDINALVHLLTHCQDEIRDYEDAGVKAFNNNDAEGEGYCDGMVYAYKDIYNKLFDAMHKEDRSNDEDFDDLWQR